MLSCLLVKDNTHACIIHRVQMKILLTDNPSWKSLRNNTMCNEDSFCSFLGKALSSVLNFKKTGYQFCLRKLTLN